MRWLIILLLLTGCAKPFHKTQDPEFLPYIEEFQKTFNANVHYDVIFSEDIPWNYNGVCSYFPQVIKINKATWKYLDKCGREQLMFHELSHCSFYIRHDDKLNADNMPRSIMHPYMFNTIYYCAHRDTYIQDLKDKMGL